MSEHVIGFDLGGTKMMAALFDENFNVVAREKKKTKPELGAEKCFDRMVECLKDLLGSAEVKAKDVTAMGLGAPGPLDHEKGILCDTPNLGWKNFPVVQRFNEKFDFPVVLENDVNCGTMGEFRYGAARGGSNVIGIFPGTGIGGGLIFNGRLYRGASGMAGEIGHMITEQNGLPCGCGGHGCLETVASRSYLSAMAWLLSMRGDAPHLLDDSSGDISKIKSGALSRSAENGDVKVKELVTGVAERLGEATASLINVLSPDTVVFGGGLVEAMGTVVMPVIRQTIAQRAMPLLAKHVKVVEASLGDDAVAIGAAAMAVDSIKDKPGEKVDAE